jgi:hypothetical protein
MAIAVTPKKGFDYILVEDRTLPVEQQTVWELRALTVGEQTDVQDSLRTEKAETGETLWKSGTMVLQTLRAGLRGVRNFMDTDGKAVKFETDKSGKVTLEFLDLLLPKWRNELANAIAAGGQLSEKDRD